LVRLWHIGEHTLSHWFAGVVSANPFLSQENTGALALCPRISATTSAAEQTHAANSDYLNCRNQQQNDGHFIVLR
jgi:hypothetical protein